MADDANTPEQVPLLLIGPEDDRARQATASADPYLLREIAGERGRQSIDRRGFFRDSADKWLFMLFAALGAASIAAKPLAARWLGLTDLMAETLPVGTLAAYALSSYRLAWFRLHPDRLGDNCYYMGFLFTLVSLSMALISVQNQSGAARGEMLEGLIGSFGIALFSTIGGIALRVFFMQMRREVEDIEEAIRNELQEAARRLTAHLGQAVVALESFRLRTEQAMDEQLHSQLSAFAETSKKLMEYLGSTAAAHAAASGRLTEGTERAAENLARTAESMAAQVKAAGAAHGQAARRLAGSSEKVVAEISRLVERIDTIEVPSDLLTRQVDDARQRIGALATALEGAAAADAARQAAVERAAMGLDHLLARLSNLSAFEALENSADRLGSVVDSAGAAVSNIGQRMTSQAETFAGLVAQAERDASAMSEARQALQADLAQSTEALHKLQDTLADVAESLVRRLAEE